MITSTQLIGQRHLCCTSQFSGFGIGDEPLVEWGILHSPGMKPNRARYDNTGLNEPHLSRAPQNSFGNALTTYYFFENLHLDDKGRHYLMRLWGMVTSSAEPDDGKPKNIMGLKPIINEP